MQILSAVKIFYEVGDKQILDDISLSIEKGDCISLIGSSGSGKSSFLKMCSYLISPSSGTMSYNDTNFSDYEPITLRQELSYCTQMPYLFGTTVKENLEFPFIIKKNPFDIEKVAQLLEAFQLDRNLLEKEVAILSGGEKQRIALIRNLIHNPKILLLDEVTSALDESSSLVIEKYVKELNKNGTTILWVTHNLEQSTRIFNKRVQFENGKVVNLEVL